MKITFDHNSQSYALDLTTAGKIHTVSIDGETYPVEILGSGDGWFDIRLPASKSVPASAFTAYISSDGPKRWVTVNGQTFVLTKSAGTTRRGGHGHHAAGELIAPMPGQVRAVQVAEGEVITKGQTLVVVEAMKMEIKVSAPGDGVVKSVLVKTGQTVEREQILVVLENS